MNIEHRLNDDFGVLVGSGNNKNDRISSKLPFEDAKCTDHKTRNYSTSTENLYCSIYLVKNGQFPAEMRLQRIMVVLFIILNWMFGSINTATMIPCRRNRSSIFLCCSLSVGNKPQIQVHPPDHLHVVKGQTISVDCLATGIPSPAVYWYYVGPVWSQHVKHSLRNNSKYTIYSNGTLVIRNVQKKDMGVFECEARNVMGSASKQFKIYTPSKL